MSEKAGMNRRSAKGKISAATIRNSDLVIAPIIAAGRAGSKGH
jgi:hypothetical protein